MRHLISILLLIVCTLVSAQESSRLAELLDANDERFLVAERYARGALDLAGATAVPFSVWIDDWEIASRADSGPRERWRLVANDDAFALALDRDALKPPVPNGDRGLSQKSDEPGNASYYYSITRLDTSGEILLDGERFEVRGTSWLDRKWSSSALADNQEGWTGSRFSSTTAPSSCTTTFVSMMDRVTRTAQAR